MPSGWLGWDWGNVPAWVGSLLTGSSLGLAAFTYYRNSADRRQARQDTERAQVARISFWWVNPRKASVRNSNDVAVTVRAALTDAGGGEVVRAVSDRVGFAPGETRSVLLPAGSEEPRGALLLSVVDSFGRVWLRFEDGELRAVTSGAAEALPDPTRPDPTRPDPTRPGPTQPDPAQPDLTRLPRQGQLRWEDR